MSQNARPAQVVKCMELLSTGERVGRVMKDREMYENIITMVETKIKVGLGAQASLIDLGLVKHGLAALIGIWFDF